MTTPTQDGVTDPITKADMRRAVIRTAAHAHWSHHFNFTRLVSSLPRSSAGALFKAPATFQFFDDARGEGAERFCSVSPFHEVNNGIA